MAIYIYISVYASGCLCISMSNLVNSECCEGCLECRDDPMPTSMPLAHVPLPPMPTEESLLRLGKKQRRAQTAGEGAPPQPMGAAGTASAAAAGATAAAAAAANNCQSMCSDDACVDQAMRRPASSRRGTSASGSTSLTATSRRLWRNGRARLR